jgi:hypothetical protein
MADVPWPEDQLPYKFLREDFGGNQPHQPADETEMQAGNVVMMYDYSISVAIVQGSTYMTEAQFDAFRLWERDTLSRGTRRFTRPLFVASGYVTKSCEFVGGTYKWARMGMGWRVSYGLRVYDW